MQIAPGVDVALVMALLICLDDARGELAETMGATGEIASAMWRRLSRRELRVAAASSWQRFLG